MPHPPDRATASKATVQHPTDVTTYTLVMDQDTAQTLADLMTHVGGGDRGRGEFMQEIVSALDGVGIRGRDSEIRGTVQF